MRKPYLVFLAGVIGFAIWVFQQHFQVAGLDKVQLTPRDSRSADALQFPVSTPAKSDRDIIRLATFNIQVFGRDKLSKPDVMNVLASIVQRFDVVAIQEIRSRDDDILPRFVDLVNAGGRHYDYVVGPRLGRSNSKEQYGFVFDLETIEVNRTQLYTVNDPDDVLHREPLVGWFRARAAPPEHAFTFSLVNIHTDPDEVDREINVMDDILRAVRDDGRDEDDTILLGDFNTDERKFDQLGRIANLQAVIPYNVATNTLGTKSYDNIVFDRLATTEYNGRAGVFDFVHEEFNLSKEGAAVVSDHLPVWAEFSVFEGGTAGRIANRPRTGHGP